MAGTIAARLERLAEAQVWLEECRADSSQTVATWWDRGLSSAAILLVLSPDAVPVRLNREDWQSLLEHVEANAEPQIGTVLARDCKYPGLLARRRCFRWGDHARDALRSIERWIVSLHQSGASERSPFTPARLPWFQGNQDEIETLWQHLGDGSGAAVLFNAAPRSGKTSLAQEFARAASAQFRDVLWIECGGRTAMQITGELASRAGISLDTVSDFSSLYSLIQRHRVLLVFDDVTEAGPWASLPPERASVLFTTRSSELNLAPHVRIIPVRSPEIFVTQAPTEPVDRSLWQSMAICRPQGFPLELAARIAGVDQGTARTACERMILERLIDPLDAAGTRFRLGAGSPDTAGEALQRRHAEALLEVFSNWRKRPGPCEESIAELDAAFQWAFLSDWSLAIGLAASVCAFLNARGRRPEAAHVYTQLQQAARERRDLEVIEQCSWELSWIQDGGGEIRPVAAMRDQLVLDF